VSNTTVHTSSHSALRPSPHSSFTIWSTPLLCDGFQVVRAGQSCPFYYLPLHSTTTTCYQLGRAEVICLRVHLILGLNPKPSLSPLERLIVAWPFLNSSLAMIFRDDADYKVVVGESLVNLRNLLSILAALLTSLFHDWAS